MNNKLFTPGPLTTSAEVKNSMLCDYGSRDDDFLKIIANIRNKLVNIACYKSKKQDEYTTVLLQGSGTYCVEAVLNSCIPKKDEHNKLLLIINGKYGDRMKQIAQKMDISIVTLEYDETEEIKLIDVEKFLQEDKNIKYVGMIHHETSTGQINSVSKIGKFLKNNDVTFIVDSMSAFGAIEIDIFDDGIDFLISSSNKCFEGVPGFAYTICNKEKLFKSTYSTSICFDLLEQWNNFEKTKQFRFTPPTHIIVAFNKALEEYEEEGGLIARMTRYKENYNILVEGMQQLGFTTFLPKELQGYFITSFLYLNTQFDFNNYYDFLKDNNIIIYPGKTTKTPSFRIGNIGKLFKNDMEKLLNLTKKYIQLLNSS
jgi:2-aminoethylphosphonate-pyruvate transaminase